MIRIEEYTIEKEKIWNEFIANSKNSLFMFDRNYMDYHKDRFHDNSLMFYYDDELISVLPLTAHGNELRSHGGLTYGGFITSVTMKQSIMMECFDVLREYCQSKNICCITYKRIPFFYCSQPAEEDRYALYINKAKLLKIEASTVINLKNPLQMAKLRLRQTKKAIKSGVVISKDNSLATYKKYIYLLNEVLNEHHDVNAVHTAEELFMLHERFPNNILLISSNLDNEMIAGTVLFVYDNVIHTQYLASNDVGRKVGALDYVISLIIDEFKGEKEYLDFGISTEDMGRYLNNGLISQKEGFGGRTVTYETWTLEI